MSLKDEEKLNVSNEIEYYRKRRYKLSKAKDIIAIVCGISLSLTIGSCSKEPIGENGAFTWYSYGSFIGSAWGIIYFGEEAQKCDKEIKRLVDFKKE